MILTGVHAISLRAYSPIVLPGKPQRFATGSKAAWSGAGLIVTALLVGAFWGALAWAVWSNDMALIGTCLRIRATPEDLDTFEQKLRDSGLAFILLKGTPS
jgi:hypothetical protein